MRAYWALPESLQIAAYSAEREYARPQEQAILVIQCLTEKDYAAIGVYVWLATEVGPTMPTPAFMVGKAIRVGRPNHGLRTPNASTREQPAT